MSASYEHVYRPHGYGSWHIAEAGADRTLCGQQIGSSWSRHPFDPRAGGSVECRSCRASSKLDWTLRLPRDFG